MNGFQKVVKYLAMALALLLTIGIIGGVCTVVFGIVSSKKEEKVQVEVQTSNEYETKEFSSMDIESGVANVTIEIGDKFYVTTENVPETLVTEVSHKTLIIKNEDKFNWKNWLDKEGKHEKARITITVPKGTAMDKVTINGGVGDVTISDFYVETLKIDGGVGKVVGVNLTGDDVRVDTGVGDIKLEDVTFNDCKFDNGVGNFEVSGTINGDIEVNGGVGNCDLSLNASRKDYNLDIDAGVGSIHINGEKCKELKENNKSKRKISVDGGVGNVDIVFTKDK